MHLLHDVAIVMDLWNAPLHWGAVVVDWVVCSIDMIFIGLLDPASVCCCLGPKDASQARGRGYFVSKRRLDER